MKRYKERILNKYRGKFSEKEKLSLLVIIVSILLTFTVSRWFFLETINDLENQRKYELIQTSKHTVYHFKSFLEQKMEWMSMVAVSASMSEESDEMWWDFLKQQTSEESRMGIVDKRGTMHFGDHQKKDVREKEYFKRAIAGESYVSMMNPKEMNGEDSIVLSVPMKGIDGDIAGVIVVEYTTRALGDYIQEYEGEWIQYGANMVIDDDGRIVASPEGMEKYDTIWDFFQRMELENTASVEKMKQNIIEEKPGDFLYYNHGKRRRLHYMPAEVNGWTVVSIGAMKKYLSILERIEQRNWISTCIYIFIILVDVVAASYIIYSKMKRINKLKKDLLTGVYRRREGEKIVEAVFSEKHGRRIWGCLFIDVDDFKNINDTLGHDAGDEVLSTLGTVLNSCVRPEDIVYRYGGMNL